MDIETVRRELILNKQEHLLQFWEQLNKEQQLLLFNDLKSINFGKVCEIFRKNNPNNAESIGTKLDEMLQPLSNDVHQSITRTSTDKLHAYREKGLRKISEGKVAALLLAGGQGTRLGVDYPKGMYDVGLPSHKTLFHLQGERLKRLEQLAYELTGKYGMISWYIMTSEATKEPTLEFFEKHSYFGLTRDNIVIFEQNTLPCFTLDGKIILELPYKVARAPDGNGGLYYALQSKGILDDMQLRGVEHIHVYCVDNILVKIADPTFIGYCISKEAEAAAKVVEKAFPTEAVGIICRVGGKYQVVEYTEVSLQTAQKRNNDGRLAFNAGNICNHYFTLNFLKNVVQGKELIHHIAKKKIPYIDNNGKIVKPDKPNGIKFEKFVFDVFEFTDKFVVWEVLREDEFSPLKNGDDSDKDTPTTARQSVYNLHQRYILNSGGIFVDESGKSVPLIASPVKAHVNGINGNHTNGNHSYNNNNNNIRNNNHKESQVICEISPLISYDGEGLEKLVSGKLFRSPFTLLHNNQINANNGKQVSDMNGYH